MLVHLLQVEVAKQHVTEHCRREELKPQLLADLDNLKTDPTFDIISSLEQTLKTKISNMEEEMVKNKVLFAFIFLFLERCCNFKRDFFILFSFIFNLHCELSNEIFLLRNILSNV